MAQYWVYLNNEVAGPYAVEQLIRLRGFSRQTLVCVDDSSGQPTHWISPAEIPELSHIFKAADEHQTLMPAAAPAKIQQKPAVVRAGSKAAGPAVILKRAPVSRSSVWLWGLLAAVMAAGIVSAWLQYSQRAAQAQEQLMAKSLVENARLPSSSLYATLNQYLHDKALRPRWEFERLQEGLYHVTLSWYQKEGSSVYSFEVNSQAQTVRGINTAAMNLLSEGFAPPPSARSKPVPAKKKSPSDLFAGTLDNYRQAVEGGDFQTVWGSFSRRKKSEMARGGMSKDGFLRLQNLTFKVDSAAKQAILKTIDESDRAKLVLLKQSQAGRSDILIKQFWIFEGDDWKLDDEQKRSTAAPAVTPSPAPAPELSTAAPVTPSAPPVKPAPASLPGMSN